ncbi:helix-turn-helix domain-containing protein [Acidobacteria bacterium AH-259-O06]|nr:helix-turn-helix domain-containing protein [Acidobacteria bacterium AH-259-O06]
MNTFYRTHEVGRILKLSESSIYRLIHSGELQVIRIGRTIRIRAEDLEAFLRRKTVRS